MEEFKTDYRKKRDKRDLAIVKDFNKLTKEGKSKIMVTRHLCEKYGIKSPTTIYNIRNRIDLIK